MIRSMDGFRIATALLAAALFAACDKNPVQELPFAPLLDARIKFFDRGRLVCSHRSNCRHYQQGPAD